jgi:hypothetical protein
MESVQQLAFFCLVLEKRGARVILLLAMADIYQIDDQTRCH